MGLPDKHMEVNFIGVHCCNCHISFYIPESKYDQCSEDSAKNFYCPNGHPLVYRDSELKKEIKRREWAEADAKRNKEWARDAERDAKASEKRASTYKGHLTRVKRRIANGVCPCCKRSFMNLKRHINMKHPEWEKDHGHKGN